MVVCKRCIPPEEIINKLRDEGIYERSLTFRAPYAVLRGQQSIYYVLVHNNEEGRKKILLRMKEDSKKGGENKPDDKYLAMATWKPYIETNWFRAYIGYLPSTGCFHKLRPNFDCDEE